MFKYFNNRRRKGQSTLEYAILVIIIIGALLSIQVYIKRGVQGRLKSAADDIGAQFKPGDTNVVMVTTTSSTSSDTFIGGVTKSQLLNAEVTTDLMNSQINTVNEDYWGGP